MRRWRRQACCWAHHSTCPPSSSNRRPAWTLAPTSGPSASRFMSCWRETDRSRRRRCRSSSRKFSLLHHRRSGGHDPPSGLDGAIACCLQRDLRLRYANIAEMASAFAPFGSPGAKLSAERISLIITGTRGGSQPVLLALESRPAEARQRDGTTAPFAPAATMTIIVGAGNTGAEPWVGTLRGNATRSRALLWAGIFSGAGLVAAAVLAIVVWRGRGRAAEVVDESSAVTASPQSSVGEPPVTGTAVSFTPTSAPVETTAPAAPSATSSAVATALLAKAAAPAVTTTEAPRPSSTISRPPKATAAPSPVRSDPKPAPKPTTSAAQNPFSTRY